MVIYKGEQLLNSEEISEKVSVYEDADMVTENTSVITFIYDNVDEVSFWKDTPEARKIIDDWKR